MKTWKQFNYILSLGFQAKPLNELKKWAVQIKHLQGMAWLLLLQINALLKISDAPS